MINFEKINKMIDLIEESQIMEGLTFNEFAMEFYSEVKLVPLSRYLKTKFVRMLIMLAKANQNGTRKTYRFVPLQNFTNESDINWSQSIAEIDQQLYRKYELSEEEIMFIEENVKEMG